MWNPKKPYLKLEKEKENFCVLFNYFIKRAREVRKFHGTTVQRRRRNVHKTLRHVQRSCFANINLLLSFCSLWRRCRRMLYELAIVVIQKFCNQDNVMSDFSSLFSINDTELNPSDFYFLY